MNIAISLLALAVAAAASLFVDRKQGEPSEAQARRIFAPVRVISLLLLPALAALAAVLLKGSAPGMMQVAIGLGISALVSLVAQALDRGALSIAPLALAVAATAALQTLGRESRENAQLGLIVGLGAGAWLLLTSPEFPGAGRAALLGLAAAVGDALGARAESLDTAALTGSSLGLVVVIAALVSRAAAGKESQRLLNGGLLIALIAGGSYLAMRGVVKVEGTWLVFLLSLFTGLVVHLLVGVDESPNSFRFLLATLIWLGAATASFSAGQGYGMATALMGAVSVPLVLGNSRALLTLGPLATLVLYRVFREMHTEATKAIDIGQHYALIGFGVGAILPLLPIEWKQTGRGEGNRFAVASLLWAVLIVTAPLVVAILLGSKGAIGLIFGLGFASVLHGLTGGRTLAVFGLAMSAAAATVASYGWLEPLLELERDEKKHLLIYITAAIGMVALCIFCLSLRPATRQLPNE